MKLAAGIAFPDVDRFMVSELAPAGTYQLANLDAAMRHVKHFGRAIDGGAHVGTWSLIMAGRFAEVVAFEPSPDTFECLQFNVAQRALANVRCVQAALGAAPGFVSMALDKDNEARANTGARFTRPGGTIPVVTIDSLKLADVGFIKLDIEGSEPAALEGAQVTLGKYKPIVLFENKRLWTRHHGKPKDAVVRILQRHRYKLLQQVACDQIWGPS
jgi:FkbM family methyltransferase